MKAHIGLAHSTMLAAILGVLLPGTAPAQDWWPLVVQEHYQWRNDDNDEIDATYKAAEDTAYLTQERNENIRLRFVLRNTLTEVPLTATDGHLRLEYSESQSSGYQAVPVTATTEPFEMTLTDNYANYDDTSQQLNTDAEDYVSGECIEDSTNTTQDIDIPFNTATEIEYCFQATSNAEGGKTYYFRLGNESLGGYYQYARLRVLSPPTVTNAAADPVTATSATLRGGIAETGGEDPTAYIHWGTHTALLTNTINLGIQNGEFSTNLAGLVANRTYYYKCTATNSANGASAATHTNFVTTEPAVHFTGHPYEVDESGVSCVVTVRLDDVSHIAVGVNFATADGTATTADSDYASTNNTLTWPAGETGDKTFSVPITSDGTDEPNQTIILNLSGEIVGEGWDQIPMINKNGFLAPAPQRPSIENA